MKNQMLIEKNDKIQYSCVLENVTASKMEYTSVKDKEYRNPFSYTISKILEILTNGLAMKKSQNCLAFLFSVLF